MHDAMRHTIDTKRSEFQHTCIMAKKILKHRSVWICTSIVFASFFILQIIITTTLLNKTVQPFMEVDPGSRIFLVSKAFVEDGDGDGDGDGKYLQYFVQAGWANQVICLKHAYEVALATGRGLILAPVVPHFQLYMKDVMDTSTQEFYLGYDLKKAYLKKLAPSKYVSLGNVLDLKASLPGLVSKVDFRDFYRNHAGSSVDPLAMEANASHFNTHWIRNQSAFEGFKKEIVAVEHQVDVRYNRTFRDIARFSETSPFREYPVWTLLDSFRVTLHKSVYHDGKGSSFRPRFHTKILAASQTIWRDRWQGIHYASVHIRGSDGYFKDSKRKAINLVLNLAGLSINEWIENHKPEANTTTTTTKSTKTIGLFVATDIPNLRTNNVFQKKTSTLTKSLKDRHGIDLKLLFSDDNNGNDGGSPAQKEEPHVEALFDPNHTGWVGYPGVFLDQQLAACATIGFMGTEGSSFSNFIKELRKDDLTTTCDHDFELP